MRLKYFKYLITEFEVFQEISIFYTVTINFIIQNGTRNQFMNKRHRVAFVQSSFIFTTNKIVDQFSKQNSLYRLSTFVNGKRVSYLVDIEFQHIPVTAANKAHYAR